jgi:hypothetical protein
MLRLAVWLADIKGAFDHACRDMMRCALTARGIPDGFIRVMTDWMSHRSVSVVVDGMHSEDHRITDQVFQGSVWGPTLWNLFIADVENPIRSHGWLPILYADDLTAVAAFKQSDSEDSIREAGRIVAEEAPCWGRARRVRFDPGKESLNFIAAGSKDAFQLLGVKFDGDLTGRLGCEQVSRGGRRRVSNILQARCYFGIDDIMSLYKANVLGYIEAATPGIFHACSSFLSDVDKVQEGFLREVGLNDLDSLVYYGLAPLATRRDIAILALSVAT